MASRSGSRYIEDEPHQQRGLVGAVKSALYHHPIAPFVSRTALRAYLTTFLVISTIFVLLGCAITAYVLFYWSYIPRIGFERTIHLQFDNVYEHATAKRAEHPYPYGSVNLAPDLVGLQGYDVVVDLVMPRTPENQDAGNFMLEVTMYAQDERAINTPVGMSPLDAARLDLSPTSTTPDASSILAISRRHAILPYRSWMVELLHTFSSLPWYFFNLREETHKLSVPIFEKVAFAKGRQNLPATLQLEIQSTHTLQVYNAAVRFRARFTGLRWIMYNHRIISAFVFITSFWMTELVFFGLAWALLSFYFSSASSNSINEEQRANKESAGAIKQEADEDLAPVLSDTERQFPTLKGQPPLRYSRSPTPRVKQEPDDEPVIPPVTPAAEADDEDEEDVDFFDSGIGTSLESSNPSRRDSIRRRRGRLSGRPDEDQKAY
ncbi:Seipin [Pseudocercospora fuligena]|uniref:Seipin n=1 Tax=Pseudocercospora fuligena TaxID=685502 RepID=A0A8H6VLD6_9PEZI|nr:Seipin [Pseudocercospora fuligena]